MYTSSTLNEEAKKRVSGGISLSLGFKVRSIRLFNSKLLSLLLQVVIHFKSDFNVLISATLKDNSVNLEKGATKV